VSDSQWLSLSWLCLSKSPTDSVSASASVLCHLSYSLIQVIVKSNHCVSVCCLSPIVWVVRDRVACSQSSQSLWLIDWIIESLVDVTVTLTVRLGVWLWVSCITVSVCFTSHYQYHYHPQSVSESLSPGPSHWQWHSHTVRVNDRWSESRPVTHKWQDKRLKIDWRKRLFCEYDYDHDEYDTNYVSMLLSSSSCHSFIVMRLHSSWVGLQYKLLFIYTYSILVLNSYTSINYSISIGQVKLRLLATIISIPTIWSGDEAKEKCYKSACVHDSYFQFQFLAEWVLLPNLFFF